MKEIKQTAHIKAYLEDYREKNAKKIRKQKQDYYRRNQAHLIQYQKDFKVKQV